MTSIKTTRADAALGGFESSVEGGSIVNMGSANLLRSPASVTRLVRAALVGVALFAYSCLTYHLMYQLFITTKPLESLGTVSPDSNKSFRFEGVSYFRGHNIVEGGRLTVTIYAPEILVKGHPKFEVFVEIDSPEFAEIEDHDGKLIIHSSAGDTFTKTLNAERNQRFTTELALLSGTVNTITYDYTAIKSDPSGLSLNIAAVVVDYSLWREIAASTLVLIFCLLAIQSLSSSINGRSHPRSLVAYWVVIITPVLLAMYVHSGAIVSNEVFPAKHGRMGAGFKQAETFLQTFEVQHGLYRPAAFLAVPLLTKGFVHERFVGEFVDYYPLSKIVVFILFSLSLMAATLQVYKSFTPMVGIIFGIILAIFYPFIADLYFMESDGYFIMIFPAVFACFLWWARTDSYKPLAIALPLMFLMGAIKSTTIIVPVAFGGIVAYRWLVDSWHRQRTIRVLSAALAIVAFNGTYYAGKKVSDAFYPENRHIGVPELAFQKSVLWEMVWAAYGLFDPHSAHGFVKGGALRDEYVSRELGYAERVVFIRHSEAANEVYKPAVLRALKERPGFFYATSFLRLEAHAVKFFRYTYGSGDFIKPWLDQRRRGATTISGKEVPVLSLQREAIRYGEGWKLSPTLLAAKLSLDMTPGVDLSLLVAAIIGFFLIKRRDVIVFCLALYAVQLVGGWWIHGINRYLNYIDVVLILGLALFLHRAGRIFYHDLSIFYAERRGAVSKSDPRL